MRVVVCVCSKFARRKGLKNFGKVLRRDIPKAFQPRREEAAVPAAPGEGGSRGLPGGAEPLPPGPPGCGGCRSSGLRSPPQPVLLRCVKLESVWMGRAVGAGVAIIYIIIIKKEVFTFKSLAGQEASLPPLPARRGF